MGSTVCKLEASKPTVEERISDLFYFVWKPNFGLQRTERPTVLEFSTFELVRSAIASVPQKELYELHKTEKPMIDFGFEPSLACYYEIYDYNLDKTILILGEIHFNVMAPAEGGRALKSDERKTLHKVISALLRDPRPADHKTVMLELPVTVEGHPEFRGGGGPFIVDEETGRAALDPSFDPTEALLLPKQQIVRKQSIKYINETARRHGIQTVNVDARFHFISYDKIQSIVRPWCVVNNLLTKSDGIDEIKSRRAQISRQKVFLMIFYSICYEILSRDDFDHELFKFLAGKHPLVATLLNFTLNELKAMMKFYGVALMTETVLENSTRVGRPTPYDVDIWTFVERERVISFINMFFDLYAVRKILNQRQRNNLTILYAGANHAENIAKMLLSSKGPNSYVLRHVGHVKTLSDGTRGLTTRFPDATSRDNLMNLYRFHNTQEYVHAPLAFDNEATTYSEFNLLFNNVAYTRFIYKKLKELNAGV